VQGDDDKLADELENHVDEKLEGKVTAEDKARVESQYISGLWKESLGYV
jgi:hypothetical protein